MSVRRNGSFKIINGGDMIDNSHLERFNCSVLSPGFSELNYFYLHSLGILNDLINTIKLPKLLPEVYRKVFISHKPIFVLVKKFKLPYLKKCQIMIF